MKIMTGCVWLIFLGAGSVTGETILLEAEGFAELGGWAVDTQSMEQMGSAYLLAHGLGTTVQDAVTKVTVPKAGKYRLWVRTRDWVAPWKVTGAPGKFEVMIDGKAAPTTFGTKGEAWHWQDGGKVTIDKTEVTIALHDLTGFDGRLTSPRRWPNSGGRCSSSAAPRTKARLIWWWSAAGWRGPVARSQQRGRALRWP
jgi:hypothetical protein